VVPPPEPNHQFLRLAEMIDGLPYSFDAIKLISLMIRFGNRKNYGA
jgi:hypothetical protein